MTESKQTVKGLAWMGSLRLVSRMIAFVRLGVLARLLSPFEFGLFGIATLTLSLLETLTETGINVFFIQKEGDLDEYVNTAWLFSIFRGLVIFLTLFIFADSIGSFFHSGGVTPLIKFIAVIGLLRGFINPSEVKFQKELKFNKEFLLRISTLLADVIVSLAAAFITKSAISLIWGLLASVVVEIIFSHTFIKPRPRFIFEMPKFKKVVSRGKWITLAGIFQYFFAYGDNIVVGKLMDSFSLGLYQNAYRISIIPITEVSDIFGKVTFPVYSKIADNKKKLLTSFSVYSAILGLIVINIGAFIYFYTEPVVRVLLGERWLVIVPALKILSIFGSIKALLGAAPPLFLALKKQEYLTMTTLVSIFGLGVTIIPLVKRFGIVGASYSALIGTLLSLPVIGYCLYKVFR